MLEDSKDALECSKCRRVMIKYRVSSNTDNRIDYCIDCEDIWLDAGEWHLIERIIGTDQLATVLTRPWQRKIVGETVEKMERQRLESLFGDEFSKVQDVTTWLKGHRVRDEILAYLHRNSR